MASSKVYQGESIFMPPRTGALAIAYIHPHGVKGFGGSTEEFAMVVPSDRGHVPNREWWVAFMIDLEPEASAFKHTPVVECATAEHAFQVVAGHTFGGLGS
jgi:hypothetical protein